MIQYRRRNSNTPLQHRDSEPVHLLLAYCNWSYPRDNHINIQTLRSMLSQYQEEYTLLYLRIINETPCGLISSFIEHEQLNSNILEDIHGRLRIRGFDIRDLNELYRMSYDIDIFSEDFSDIQKLIDNKEEIATNIPSNSIRN